MARQYKRDARGRFASGGSTGRRAGGTLAARASLRSSRRKLAAKDSADGSLKGTLSRRAQKGAVTKGSKRLKEAKKAATVRIAGRRGGTIDRPKGYVRPEGKGKPTTESPKTTPAPAKAPKGSRSAKTPKSNTPTQKRKVDVQIKRAKPGGEYGPDGHFYSGGSWMPLGQFKGGGKKEKGVGGTTAGGAKQDGKDGNSSQIRVIRQSRKEQRPPLKPSGPSKVPSPNVSDKGKDNMTDFFPRGYFSAYKERRDGFIELKPSGWRANAAMATRLTPKETGAAIVKLRRMARDKKEFDAELAWELTLRRNDPYGYDSARRGGYIPRGMTRNQWVRTSQLDRAIGMIASQRSQRPNNRRTGTEEYVWVMNNLLGTRASKRVTKKVDTASPKSRRLVTGPGIKNAFRPIFTKRLVAAGGSRWQKGSHDRIYFNAARSGKVFFDRNSRRMVTQGGDPKELAAEVRRIARSGRRPIQRRWKRGRVPK